MKKAIILVSVLFCCMIVIACLAYFPLGKLFCESTLREYHIPWLQAPEKAMNVREDYNANSKQYLYEADLPSQDSYFSYIEYVLQEFLTRGYTAGYLVSTEDTSALTGKYTSCHIFSPSTKLSDYTGLTHEEVSSFRLYYTSAPLGAFSDRYDGYSMQDTHGIRISLENIPDDEGMYRMSIVLVTILNEGGDYFRIPEETTEPVE